MKKYILLLAILIVIGCQKTVSIAKFKDDFKDYKVELRIEAILNQTEFSESIVRIDKTMLVTDITLFNGIDDNGNGLIDEYAEILPQIHDSTMSSVELFDKNSGQRVAEFIWDANAGSLFYTDYTDEFENVVVYETYGGYIPKYEYNSIDIKPNNTYEFRIKTLQNDLIKGATIPYSPPIFQKTGQIWDADTLDISKLSTDKISWVAVPEGELANISIWPQQSDGSFGAGDASISFPEEFDETGNSIYSLSTNLLPEGISKIEFKLFSNEYSRYFLSSLPLDDGELSNLRDQNGNVILGIAGSEATTIIYVKNIL